MSFRPELKPFPVIENGNMASTSIIGDATIIQKISMLSYAFSWAGSSPVGELSVQVSNDYALDAQGAVSNAGTWTTLLLNVAGSPAASIAVSGNTGTGFIDIDTCGAYAIRPVYTKTSGTGTLQGTINGKVS